MKKHKTLIILQGAFKGLSVFSEAVVSNLTGSKPSTPPKKSDLNQIDNGNRPGIISIVDLQNIHGDHVSHNSNVLVNNNC